MSDEFVMAPRELLERIARAGCWPEDEEALRGILTKPSGRYRGEPVAMPARYVHEHHGCFLSERQHGWNACLDEITKLGPLYTHPVHGEPVAFVQVTGQNPAKYCWMGANRALPDGMHKLYTHPDPGEVKRLRLERRRMDRALVACANERDTLRALLTDRDALLRALKAECETDPMYVGPNWMKRIDAALSASAEPEQPK